MPRRRWCEQIRARGSEPLFVGGTPLYLKSLLRGLFDGPPADWKLRHEIEEELQHVGQQALYDRLAQIDPVAASHIHPHDTRRLIRASKCFEPPASRSAISNRNSRKAGQPKSAACSCCAAAAKNCISGSRPASNRWSPLGWWTKCAGLTADGRELGRTARQAVGYREALAYLAGEYEHEEMIARITYRTRRFAKRQGTWFRSLSECRFVELEGEPEADTVAKQIAATGMKPAHEG